METDEHNQFNDDKREIGNLTKCELNGDIDIHLTSHIQLPSINQK